MILQGRCHAVTCLPLSAEQDNASIHQQYVDRLFLLWSCCWESSGQDEQLELGLHADAMCIGVA